MFKVTRTYPAPNSLSNESEYKGEDVTKALKECFHSKCYLCETQNPHDINIEHFIPHGGNKKLKFKWENLYFVCSRCNNIKLARKDELIDCCDTNIDASDLIKILPPISPFAERMIIEPLNTMQKTLNTAKLLEDIYNSENTPNKEVTGAFLRNRIFEIVYRLISHMIEYLKPDTLDDEKALILRKIQKLTESSAPYSAATKHYILNDSIFGPLIFGKETKIE